MALINCKECNKKISNKAAACPNCGAPINNKVSKSKARPGGKWEAAGFILIIAGVFMTIADYAGGGWLMVIGFIIFLVGRFK